MPGLPAGKPRGGRKEGERKRTSFGKGIPHQSSHIGSFVFKKGPISTKAKTPKIHRGEKNSTDWEQISAIEQFSVY